MKSWKTLSFIGCGSYKSVSTMNFIVANAIVVFKSTVMRFVKSKGYIEPPDF